MPEKLHLKGRFFQCVSEALNGHRREKRICGASCVVCRSHLLQLLLCEGEERRAFMRVTSARVLLLGGKKKKHHAFLFATVFAWEKRGTFPPEPVEILGMILPLMILLSQNVTPTCVSFRSIPNISMPPRPLTPPRLHMS